MFQSSACGFSWHFCSSRNLCLWSWRAASRFYPKRLLFVSIPHMDLPSDIYYLFIFFVQGDVRVKSNCFPHGYLSYFSYCMNIICWRIIHFPPHFTNTLLSQVTIDIWIHFWAPPSVLLVILPFAVLIIWMLLSDGISLLTLCLLFQTSLSIFTFYIFINLQNHSFNF